MRFRVEESLSSEQVDRGLQQVVRDGVASQMMATLTGGAFLVAMALALGASPAIIGLLAAVVPLAQIAQLLGIYIVERVQVRRAVVVVAAGVSRSLWLVVAITPFLPRPGVALTVLVVTLTLHFAVGGIAGTGWNSWMRDLVPQDRLGGFFSKRLAVMTAVSIPLFLASAWFVETWPVFRPDMPLGGYSILFVLGFVAGMTGLFFLARTPEPRMAVPEGKIRFVDSLKAPFGDRNFRNLIIFFASWGFAVNLAAPFFTVYLIQRLGYPITMVVGLLVLSQIAYFFALRVWGRYTDRFSNRSVLAVCAPLFFLAVLGWTFTTLPEPHAYTLHVLVLLHIVMGVATAGTTLATGNIALKLAPNNKATSYLAANSLVHAAAAGVAPIIGGLMASYFAARELTFRLQYTGPRGVWELPTFSLSQWDFFFGIAFLVGLYALHRLSLVQEVGSIGEKVLLGHMATEVMQEMRNLSSIAGIRSMMAYPIERLRDAPVVRSRMVRTGRPPGGAAKARGDQEGGKSGEGEEGRG